MLTGNKHPVGRHATWHKPMQSHTHARTHTKPHMHTPSMCRTGAHNLMHVAAHMQTVPCERSRSCYGHAHGCTICSYVHVIRHMRHSSTSFRFRKSWAKRQNCNVSLRSTCANLRPCNTACITAAQHATWPRAWVASELSWDGGAEMLGLFTADGPFSPNRSAFCHVSQFTSAWQMNNGTCCCVFQQDHKHWLLIRLGNY